MEARNNLGNALAALGNPAAAEGEFRAGLELHPDNPETLSNLANVCFRQGKVREAFSAMAAAIKADRANPGLYNQFGLMLAANKQLDQAVTCFQNALTLSPGDIAVQINLTRALLATDRRIRSSEPSAGKPSNSPQIGQRKANSPCRITIEPVHPACGTTLAYYNVISV